MAAALRVLCVQRSGDERACPDWGRQRASAALNNAPRVRRGRALAHGPLRICVGHIFAGDTTDGDGTDGGGETAPSADTSTAEPHANGATEAGYIQAKEVAELSR